MILRSLAVENFRNYESGSFDFSEGTNVFYGDNAQGKTNALEAVFFCGMGRSYRPGKDRELIRFGEEEGHIRLRLEKDGVPHRIDVHLRSSGRKGIAIDGVPIKKAVELFGVMHVIIFAPEDLSIIKNAPAQRRSFMDMELCQLDRVYTSNLIAYNKVIMQKNKLLKSLEEDRSLAETLPLWNDQLVRYAVPVIKRRRQFIDELKEITRRVHSGITGGEEELELIYEPSCDETELADRLTAGIQKEIWSGMSQYGPHRDDLRFEINGIDVRSYGSQGQQRTAALSTKLSEIELVRIRTHDEPIVLLDDVMSELDCGRQRRLLSELSGIQTVITCTGLEELTDKDFCVDKAFLIEKGKVIKETNIRENGEKA
ncbi:MAG: DNA replication/repair protein RecF [Lachnospiraceae bacterium]|nr:DNA replication/repair protein RecF [Lachnospiraceae bacterium]